MGFFDIYMFGFLGIYMMGFLHIYMMSLLYIYTMGFLDIHDGCPGRYLMVVLEIFDLCHGDI